MIQYQALWTKIRGIVRQMVRRITNEIMGVKGLSKLFNYKQTLSEHGIKHTACAERVNFRKSTKRWFLDNIPLVTNKRVKVDYTVIVLWTLIPWIEFYPLDSAIWPLYNWTQLNNSKELYKNKSWDKTPHLTRVTCLKKWMIVFEFKIIKLTLSKRITVHSQLETAV